MGDRRPRVTALLRSAEGLGRAGYLLRHPKTQRWLARSPLRGLGCWTRGFRLFGAADGTKLVLEVESDPLESLCLGTYVSSCLGLGGSTSYSAAAIMVDINKQVVYARRPDRSVLARQVLAISDDGQLVCFEVYPKRCSSHVRRLFRNLRPRNGAPSRREDLRFCRREPALHRRRSVARVVYDDVWDLEIDAATDLSSDVPR